MSRIEETHLITACWWFISNASVFLPTEKSCLINIPKCCFHGLAGILQKLDHFQYLNIKSVWIGPLYPSPMKDFGYDVEDFRSISPEFGTMQDFDELLAEMHNIGRGLLDLTKLIWSQELLQDSSISAATRSESDHGFHSQSHQWPPSLVHPEPDQRPSIWRLLHLGRLQPNCTKAKQLGQRFSPFWPLCGC